MATWKRAAPELERIRPEELRRIDAYTAIALLSGPADYMSPRALRSRRPDSSSSSDFSRPSPCVTALFEAARELQGVDLALLAGFGDEAR